VQLNSTMAARLDLSCLLGRGLLKAPDLPNTSGAKYTRYVQLLYWFHGPKPFLLSYSRNFFPLWNPRAPYSSGHYDKPNKSIPHPPYLTLQDPIKIRIIEKDSVEELFILGKILILRIVALSHTNCTLSHLNG